MRDVDKNDVVVSILSCLLVMDSAVFSREL